MACYYSFCTRKFYELAAEVREMGPGYSVDLVLNMDLLKETIDVRKSMIYDVEGNQYVLSQTTPSIKKYDIGKFIHITHLKRQGDQHVRRGFSGKLIESIKDFHLNSSQTVQAIRVKKSRVLRHMI